MTIHEFNQILSRIRYKDVDISPAVWCDSTYSAHFSLHRRVQDVHNIGEIIGVAKHMDIPPDAFRTEKEVLKYIRHALIDFEIHELDENFFYHGKQIFDPHTTLTDNR